MHLVRAADPSTIEHRIVTLRALGSMGPAAGTVVPVRSLDVRSARDLLRIRELRQLLRAWRPQVLHSWGYHANVVARLVAAGLSSTTAINSIRGLETDKSLTRRAIDSITAGRGQRFIAVSNAAWQAYVERHVVLSPKVRVIPNGVAIPEPRRDPRNPVPTIITVGRLTEVKGIAVLLDAVAGLAASGRAVRLVVVGDGPQRRGLGLQTTKLGLQNAVDFVGAVEDPRQYMRSADIYASPALSEGMSNALLEAMSEGLACVATAVGGTPECLDATCGRLVPAGHVGALVVALSALCDDPTLRSTLGSAARERASSRFEVGRMVGAYAQAYEELLPG